MGQPIILDSFQKDILINKLLCLFETQFPICFLQTTHLSFITFPCYRPFYFHLRHGRWRARDFAFTCSCSSRGDLRKRISHSERPILFRLKLI